MDYKVRTDKNGIKYMPVRFSDYTAEERKELKEIAAFYNYEIREVKEKKNPRKVTTANKTATLKAEDIMNKLSTVGESEVNAFIDIKTKKNFFAAKAWAIDKYPDLFN